MSNAAPSIAKHYIDAAHAANQQQAILPQHSVWVAASAGAGKTTLLTNRVLRLLMAGAAPTEILCITFTKAAAAEMAGRLAKRLAAWVTLPNDALHDELHALGISAPREADFDRARQLLALVLDSAGGMRIQTINSFCQSLLANFPLESGLLPGFTLADETVIQNLQREVWSRVQPTLKPNAKALVQQYGAEKIYELLQQVLASASQWQVLGQDLTLPQRLADLLQITTPITAESFATAALHKIDTSLLQQFVAAAELEGGANNKKHAAQVKLWLGAWASLPPLIAWQSVGALLLGSGGKLHKFITDVLTKKQPALISQLQTLAERVALLYDEFQRQLALQNSLAFVELAAAYLNAITTAKRAHNIIDYADQIQLAARLLQSPAAPWVLYRLDSKIKHVLLDEAQDTSKTQWDIVQALTDNFFDGNDSAQPPTLFVVGDLKQSIYSFNGADPQAFNAMRQYFKQQAASSAQPYADLPFNLSFRTAQVVLDFVNAVFAPPEVHQAMLGAAGGFMPHQAARVGAPGQVEVWPALPPPTKNTTETWADETARPDVSNEILLAQLVAQKIAALVAAGTVLPKDVLVLVPRRTKFIQNLRRALKEQQVPVAGLDRMQIQAQLAVQDVLAAAQFALLPADDLNLAALLKTPLINMAEADLFTLAHGRAVGETLWQALQASEQHVEIVSYLQQLQATAATLRPYEFLQQILALPCPTATSGRQALWHRMGAEILDPLDELLARALAFEETHTPTLQGFVAWLASQDADQKRELDDQANEVRIITAHGAKGLEAKCVFVVDIKPKAETPKLLLTPDILPLVALQKNAASVPAIEAASAAAASARQAENLRLLYVALTRARDMLFVCAPHDYVHSWLSMLQPAAEKILHTMPATPAQQKLGLTQIWQSAGAALPESTAAQPTAALAPLPAWARQPAPIEAVPPRPLAPSQINTPLVQLHLPTDSARATSLQRGVRLHKLLQYLPDLPLAEQQRVLAQEPPELAALVTQVLHNPNFAPLFAAGSMAEVPMVGVVGAEVINAQVDRLCITPTEVLVVDYKSNSRVPQSLADVPQAYVAQMAAYTILLARLYPAKQIRPALLWLESGWLQELPLDWLQANSGFNFNAA